MEEEETDRDTRKRRGFAGRVGVNVAGRFGQNGGKSRLWPK
jgi:hypothetical protein